MTCDELYQKSESYIKDLLRKNLPSDCRVFLFGARAQNQAGRISDIDIGILPQEPLDEKILCAMKNAIDESFVPFKVDLVDFSRVDRSFKEKAMRRIREWIIN